MDSIEQEIQQLARSLYHQAAEDKPSIFEPQDWLGKMIEWSLEDESLRVALFRFVDVLPSLDSAAEIGRHLEEYFAKVDHAFGGLVFRHKPPAGGRSRGRLRARPYPRLPGASAVTTRARR